MVNFYFLTNKVKYILSEKLSSFEDETSEIKNPFFGANAVIGQIRLTTEKRQLIFSLLTVAIMNDIPDLVK